MSSMPNNRRAPLPGSSRQQRSGSSRHGVGPSFTINEEDPTILEAPGDLEDQVDPPQINRRDRGPDEIITNDPDFISIFERIEELPVPPYLDDKLVNDYIPDENGHCRIADDDPESPVSQTLSDLVGPPMFNDSDIVVPTSPTFSDLAGPLMFDDTDFANSPSPIPSTSEVPIDTPGKSPNLSNYDRDLALAGIQFHTSNGDPKSPMSNLSVDSVGSPPRCSPLDDIMQRKNWSRDENGEWHFTKPKKPPSSEVFSDMKIRENEFRESIDMETIITEAASLKDIAKAQAEYDFAEAPSDFVNRKLRKVDDFTDKKSTLTHPEVPEVIPAEVPAPPISGRKSLPRSERIPGLPPGTLLGGLYGFSESEDYENREREFKEIDDTVRPEFRIETLELLLVAATELDNSTVMGIDVFSIEFGMGEDWKKKYTECLRRNDYQAAVLIKCFALASLCDSSVEMAIILRQVHEGICLRVDRFYCARKGIP